MRDPRPHPRSPTRAPHRATLDLPPSGYVAGIYARSDIERGVHKAPANEVVLGHRQVRQTNVTFDRQSVLNPEGINALRFFEGRGNRVWGARTMSSDPEWKYVNVRRLFIYLEHSIDKSTQWAVFEPNNERLWAIDPADRSRTSCSSPGATGALMGTKPEEAFFVRCDRTHDDPERPRQRAADLPDRRRADLPGRVRDLPHRPVDRRLASRADRQPIRR